MRVTVGTFNLNNLFSRFNFEAELPDHAVLGVEAEVAYVFNAEAVVRLRQYNGQLVQAKSELDTQRIAARVLDMDVDVLAVQEVEDLDALRGFNRDYLDGRYPHAALIDGNDPRLIDVGVLSKLPLGAVTTWQTMTHPEDPERPVFSRDCLEVEVLDSARRRRLFTLFNTHLKSRFVAWDAPDAGASHAYNQTRRRRQAEALARIVEARTRPSSRYVVAGDMNDTPDSACLAAFAGVDGRGLVNALANCQETRPPKADDPMPASSAWTHRYKPRGRPAEYALLDQIWLSPALAARQTGAWVHRRRRHGGDGSDHDPAWVALEL